MTDEPDMMPARLLEPRMLLLMPDETTWCEIEEVRIYEGDLLLILLRDNGFSKRHRDEHVRWRHGDCPRLSFAPDGTAPGAPRTYFDPEAFDDRYAHRVSQHGTVRFDGHERRVSVGDELCLVLEAGSVDDLTVNGRPISRIPLDS